MSSIVKINGQTFEERNGKCYLNGVEIIGGKLAKHPMPAFLIFCLGALCGSVVTVGIAISGILQH